MRDINPRLMNDVKISKGGNVSTVVAHTANPKVPQSLRATLPLNKGGEKDRIGRNPFFQKGRGSNPRQEGQNNRSSHFILWFLVAGSLLGAGFAVANYFSVATIEIEPITRNATVKQDFVVAKDGTEGELVFKFMSITEEKSKEVPADEEKKIQKKASGRVTILNAYNGESQRLIKNTRLESTDHKIFRIEESVVVPGAKTVGGKVGEPGSVEAIIYADVPGKEYNIGISNFTIPGFKGDPRYTKFTARSKTDFPVVGGFSGAVRVPSVEAVTTAQEELREDLKKISIEKARAQIPDGVSFFPGSMILKFEDVPQDFTKTDTSNTARVLVRATVSVFFFDTALLVKKFAEVALPEYKGNLFSVPNISSLVFSFIDPVDKGVLSDLTKIRFHLEGEAVFVGKIDEQKIRLSLAGKDKKDFGKIVVGERNVGKAEAVIRPIWKTSFPDNPEKIIVKIMGK